MITDLSERNLEGPYMPKVLVKFYARLREELGFERLEIEAEELIDLLDKLRKVLGDKKDRVFEGRFLKRGILISLNDEVVGGDLERDLRDGDEVGIMPAPSGG